MQTTSPTDSSCPAAVETQALLEKGSELLKASQYKQAAELLRPASRGRCDARVNLLLAAALEGAGDSSGAREELERAHSLWPDNSSISTTIARSDLKEGHAAEAAEALKNFHPELSTPAQELEVAVVTYLAAHDLLAAETTAKTEYASYPSVHSLLLLANALQLQGRYKDVVTLLNAKRSSYADTPAFLITLAESEADEKIYDAARTDLEQAIILNGAIYQSHYLLGNVLLELGRVDQAIAEYQKSIALAPRQARTYFQLSLAYRARQDDANEKTALEKTLVLNPHFALAHSEMGRVLLNQGLNADAIRELNLAVEDNPSAEQPYYLLSRAYDRVGKKDESVAAAKRLHEVRDANQRKSEDHSSR